MSTELPVATRHRRDMAEKLLKATLNPNKQQLNVYEFQQYQAVYYRKWVGDHNHEKYWI